MTGLFPNSQLPTLGSAKKKTPKRQELHPLVRAAMIKEMGRVGFALNQIFERTGINAKAYAKLQPETRLSIAVSDALRRLSQMYYDTDGERGCRACWTHAANEGERNGFQHVILRAMGMLRGAPDLWFAWNGGSAIIELKVDGDLRPDQEHFQFWARAFTVNHAVARSVLTVMERLVGWGAIVGISPQDAADVTRGGNYGEKK